MPHDQDIAFLGVFMEPQRRRVYEHVQRAGPSTVNEIATTLEIGRTLVTFHLGKLVESGFVEVAPPEPGSGLRGRPAQRYRVTAREVVASVPDRRYDLLAGILLDSVAQHRPGESAQASAVRAARRRGAELARQLRGRRPGGGRAKRFGSLERLLAALGYAPRREHDRLTVRNCPFDKFRATNTDQVCALNQALAEGYLEGLELHDQVRARLDPCPDTCCVVFEPAPARADE